VLERAKGVVGFAAGDIGWSDVGSWNAVYDLLPKDAQGNAAAARRCSSGFRQPGGRARQVRGAARVDDLIVVETPDALLITRREHTQRVGDVVRFLEKQKRDELL